MIKTVKDHVTDKDVPLYCEEERLKVLRLLRAYPTSMNYIEKIKKDIGKKNILNSTECGKEVVHTGNELTYGDIYITYVE
jgi:hypothetical protein